jgi:pseudouridine synthase
VVELVPARKLRLYPVGRLDADSSGLILLTNDGELANGLIHPRYQIPKTYRARVRDRVGERALRALREGVQLEDGPTAPARVRLVLADRRSESLIELTIREGRNRQVRRMCAAVGHPVLALERIAFGPVGLDGLPSGSHRLLSNAEIDRLRSAGRRDGDVPNLHAEAAAGRPQEEAVGRVAGRLTAPSLTSASRRRARSCERGSVRPGAETPPAVPTIKTERLASDGPFHVGERYEVVPDGSTEHFPGVIVEVRPTGPKHLEITVELSDAEYERLLATE